MRYEQRHVDEWMTQAFGGPGDSERTARFVEEAMELAQAAGLDKEGALAVVDYVYARPVGQPYIEAGDALVTYLALASWLKVDTHEAFLSAMVRIWKDIDRIREKQRSKRVALETLKAQRSAQRCDLVAGCVRLPGHPNFHTTIDQIAKREDTKC